MIVVFSNLVNADGTPGERKIAATGFGERHEAEAYLNHFIATNQPSGHEREQDYWWIRQTGVVTRYTIRYGMTRFPR